MARVPAYLPYVGVFALGLVLGPYCNNLWQSFSPARRLHGGTPEVTILHKSPAALSALRSAPGMAAEKGKAIVNGSLHFKYYSGVGEGNLMPGFLFLQGESDGLVQSLSLNIGGGRGEKVPFVPDDTCDADVFNGASKDLRSPQLPYLKLDTWTCDRDEKTESAVILETAELRATITPQYGGKIWGMYDKINKKEFFYNNQAHQPANIGARAAWTAGGLEFNWAPGYLGHSAFTEDRVWAAKLETVKGDVIRVYEFDRYNGTVWQVDILLDGAELWTHSKVTNPTKEDLNGYWWTCAAHLATPTTRILAPAERVTVETYVGAPLRNAPWPEFNNGMLNSTFGGLNGERILDSSYLGNIAYTGDYFLRIPEKQRKWIGHQDDEGYVAMHGHPMNGTKFFTWGQSGPGRFMQDFLAGGEVGGGYYTELQSGIKPTQQQVFDLPRDSTLAFTEYYKSVALARKPDEDYKLAVDSLDSWWNSPDGIPEQKVADMEKFFENLQDREVKPAEIISQGSAWGGLQERLTGSKLAKGALFLVPESPETQLWQELADTGTFSQETLSGIRIPLTYAVDPTWVARLESSAARSSSWLHDVLLAVAYAEAGETQRPQQLLQRSLLTGTVRSPVAARCLAVLTTDKEATWSYLSMAWDLALQDGPKREPEDVTRRLRRSILGEMLLFTIGNMGPEALIGIVDKSNTWLSRLRFMVKAAEVAPLVGKSSSDLLLVSRIMLAVIDGDFATAKQLLSGECFPTFGRARDVLANLWKAAVEGEAAKTLGTPLSPVQSLQARKGSPVPRNIGCPYATLYCEDYW